MYLWSQENALVAACKFAGTCFHWKCGTTQSCLSRLKSKWRNIAKPHLCLSPRILWTAGVSMRLHFLSSLSKSYLSIAGTSVSTESVSSTTGDVVTAKWSSLKPEHVDHLVFLHKNLQSSEEFCTCYILLWLKKIKRYTPRLNLFTRIWIGEAYTIYYALQCFNLLSSQGWMKVIKWLIIQIMIHIKTMKD